jgi:GNAT superfamily N-acetyltransferase
MIIRAATLADAPGMAQVMVDSWLAAHRGQVPEAQWQQRRQEWTYTESERGWHRSLTEIEAGTNPQSCVYVAVIASGEVVGVAVGCLAELDLLPNAAEVSVLYVHPTAQGQGVGRRLVQQVATHQAALGRRALLIGCLATNAPARCFYEALGGRVVGTHETEDEGFKEPQVVYGWEDIQSVVISDR